MCKLGPDLTRTLRSTEKRTPSHMKLLIASSAPTDGGAGISAYSRSLAVALSAAGHEIHYASPAHQDSSFVEEHRITHFETHPEADPQSNAKDLLRYVVEQEIEGCVNNDNPVLQSIAPGLPVPILVICHMDRRIVAGLCAFHSDSIDHLVCISNDMQRTMIQRYGFPNTKCVLVHNGTFDPGHSGDFTQHDPNKLHVVVTGGYNSHKGGTRVMDSILAHPALFKNVRIDWFGPVPESAQQKLSQFSDIKFAGQVPQAVFHETLRASDVLVFASNKEGCPMTMLEAMAAGVMPIATDGVGAMRWLIESGHEGFIVHLKDFANQLAQCVEFLAQRPETVASMKQAARDRYLADFQASENAERIIDLLKRPTLDRTNPPRSFEIAAWHRPLLSAGQRPTMMQRVRYRTGWLERAGTISIEGVQ